MPAVPFERIDANAPKTARRDPILVVDDIVKRFETPDGVLTAVDHVSLSIAPGAFVGIIGPSGCGKSTLFNVIGGLLDGYEGAVKVAGERVRGPHPSIGMIFQEESTFPWRNVLDNVAFPLEIAGLPKAERYDRARHFVKLVGLDGFERRYPAELSRGMRPRPSRLVSSEAVGRYVAQIWNDLREEASRGLQEQESEKLRQGESR